MDVNQEIDDLDGTTQIEGVGAVPNTDKRTLNSEIAVKDRDTVMLGGFIKSNKSTSRSGAVSYTHLPSAFTRLTDMGIEPFLIASSVEAVQAQRLIRTICPHCKVEQKVDRDYLRKIGFPEADIETAKVWQGAGCENCRQLGYQGRKGIYELLVVTEAIRPLVMNRANATTIAQAAILNGMRTLRTDGWTKVKNGETTIEEILRVTQIEEHMDALSGGDDRTQFIPRQ